VCRLSTAGATSTQQARLVRVRQLHTHIGAPRCVVPLDGVDCSCEKDQERSSLPQKPYKPEPTGAQKLQLCYILCVAQHMPSMPQTSCTESDSPYVSANDFRPRLMVFL
jgi:hypothetical protein